MDDLTLTFDAGPGTAAAHGLEAAGAAVDRIASGALPEAASGATVDAERGELAEVRKALNAAADAALAAATAEKEGEAAWRAWQQTAPPLSAVEAAKQTVADAGSVLRAASGTAGAGEARQRLEAAKRALSNLLQQRDDATHTLTEALRRAAERLRTRRGVKAESDPPGTSPGKPLVPEHTGTGAPKPTAPGPAAHTPAAPGPVAAPAGTGTTSSITSSQASAIAALMAGQQRPAGQPALPQLQQQPAPLSPPPAPAASIGSGSRPTNGKSAIDAADVDSITPVPLPLSSSAHVTPQAPAPVAPAAPAPPQTTGTSSTDWHTNADTSGRSDGPRTALSSGLPEQMTGRAAAGGAGAAGTAQQTAPLGQQPMMPPMMGGMGGGGAASRATKVLRYSSEQTELLGHTTIAAAVKGGTIAQKRPVDAA
jgi:hypothetical protein